MTKNSEKILAEIREFQKFSPIGSIAALYAFQCGLWVLPVFHPDDGEDRSPKNSRGKRPIGRLVPDGCNDATNDIETIFRWWREKRNANIGCVPGKSGLIGIDFDDERGLQSKKKLEDQYGSLPLTWTVQTGREGGGRHEYYQTPEFSVKNKAAWDSGIDLRHHGGYLILPPSVHQSGKKYEWIYSPLENADSVELAALPQEWLNILPRQGDNDSSPKKNKSRTTVASDLRQPSTESPLIIAQCRKYVEQCAPAVSGNGGHNQTFHVACVIFYDFGLNERDGWPILLEYNIRCAPAWSEKELRHKMSDALAKTGTRPRGWRRYESESFNRYTEGEFNPELGKYVFHPLRPLPIAERFCDLHFQQDSYRTIRYYLGRFMKWDGNVYREADIVSLQADVLRFLTNKVVVASRSRLARYEPFPAGQKTTNDVIFALRGPTSLKNKDVIMNLWIGGGRPPCDPKELIFGPTRPYNWRTGKFLSPDPDWFNLCSISVDVDPDAQEPKRFLQYLQELFGNDEEAKSLLLEYCGLLLTTNTSFQKMLIIVGPKRSGKGTLARLLKELLGARNVAALQSSSMGEQFGLQDLIGKTLATISDARFSGRDSKKAVEYLLNISGEDSVLINKKYEKSETTKLETRLAILTNEIPRFPDSSGALVSRFLALELKTSFKDEEQDRHLSQAFADELPGILNLFIQGLRRLTNRGYFIQPESGKRVLEKMAHYGKQVETFVRQRCRIGGKCRCPTAILYEAWCHWCDENGCFPNNHATFGRTFLNTFPEIQKRDGGKNLFYDGIALKE